MKLKEEIDVIATGDFYYDLFEGGYIDPMTVLDEGEEDAVSAIQKINEFREFLETNQVLEIL